MVAPAVKREAVAHLKAHLGLSERRACEIAGADRKMVRYRSQRAPDKVLRGRLRDLANERRRFGGVHDAMRIGCDMASIMVSGRWQSAEMPARYGSRFLVGQSAAAKVAARFREGQEN